MPIVSIIMPVFNAENTIGLALKSIIYSDFNDYEIIICNDCSKDNTLNVINDFFRLNKDVDYKLISNKKNYGLSLAKNRCISISSGKYIASLDSDDQIHPKRLSAQVDFLNRNKHITVVGTSQKMIFPNGKFKYSYPPMSDGLIKASLFVRTTMLHPTIMVRADFLRANKIRYSSRNSKYIEDYIYFLNIYSKGGFFANLHNVYDTYNFLNTKKWEINNTKNTLNKNLIRRKILESIEIQPKSNYFSYFNLLNFTEEPKSIFEIFGLIKFIFICTKNIKNNYGGTFNFMLSRFRDLIIMSLNKLKNYFKNFF